MPGAFGCGAGARSCQDAPRHWLAGTLLGPPGARCPSTRWSCSNPQKFPERSAACWWPRLRSTVIWQLLQSFGVIYVRHVIKHASATNAVFAIVLGLLAFLYVTATAVLLAVEINVVRVNRIHPRSLLTPFTDNVTLTSGDRRAYSHQAKAQRSKGFEHVDVNFDPPSPEPQQDDPSP